MKNSDSYAVTDLALSHSKAREFFLEALHVVGRD